MSLTGKVAVVTGGGRGIGRAVALRLARDGADILLADVDGDTAADAARDIVSIGRKCLDHRIDLSRVQDIAPMMDRAVEEMGRLDILVNVAGIVKNQSYLDVTEADWDRVMSVNLKSVVFCIQAAAARMLERVPEDVKKAGVADRSYGKIVSFSSISGRRGRPLQVHYASSKAAIISVTQSAALAFAPYNINVNAICPSVVKTPMWDQNVLEKSRVFGVDAEKEGREFIARIPLKRPGTPEDMAAAAAFLCSEDSDYITGQTLNVDGGFEMD